MKTLKLLVAAIFAVAFTGYAASVATVYPPLEGFVTKAGTAWTGKTNYAIFAPSESGQAVRLTSIQVVGDNADAVLYMAGAGYSTTLVSESSGTLTVTSTNVGIVANDIIVIVDSDGDLGFGRATATGAGTIILENDPGTFTAGSKVYAMTEDVSSTVGSATVTRDAYGLFGAKKRSPLFVCIYTSAGTTETLKYATVEYYDPD